MDSNSCRLCLKKGKVAFVNALRIPQLCKTVQTFLNFEILPTDQCSTRICPDCITIITEAVSFKDRVSYNQQSIKQQILLRSQIHTIKIEDDDDDIIEVIVPETPGEPVSSTQQADIKTTICSKTIACKSTTKSPFYQESLGAKVKRLCPNRLAVSLGPVREEDVKHVYLDARTQDILHLKGNIKSVERKQYIHRNNETVKMRREVWNFLSSVIDKKGLSNKSNAALPNQVQTKNKNDEQVIFSVPLSSARNKAGKKSTSTSNLLELMKTNTRLSGRRSLHSNPTKESAPSSNSCSNSIKANPIKVSAASPNSFTDIFAGRPIKVKSCSNSIQANPIISSSNPVSSTNIFAGGPSISTSSSTFTIIPIGVAARLNGSSNSSTFPIGPNFLPSSIAPMPSVCSTSTTTSNNLPPLVNVCPTPVTSNMKSNLMINGVYSNGLPVTITPSGNFSTSNVALNLCRNQQTASLTNASSSNASRTTVQFIPKSNDNRKFKVLSVNELNTRGAVDQSSNVSAISSSSGLSLRLPMKILLTKVREEMVIKLYDAQSNEVPYSSLDESEKNAIRNSLLSKQSLRRFNQAFRVSQPDSSTLNLLNILGLSIKTFLNLPTE